MKRLSAIFMIIIILLTAAIAVGAADVTNGVITVNSADIDYDTGIITVRGSVLGGAGVRVTLAVKNSGGSVISFAQTMTMEGGGFEFSARPSQSVSIGSNEVSVMAVGSSSPLVTYINVDTSMFEKPLINEVRIEGTTLMGEVVTAGYDYYHITGAAEGNTTFQWMRSSDEAGVYTDIPQAAGRTYSLTQEDAYQYVKLKISGRSRNSVLAREVYSSPVLVAARPEARNVYIEGVAKPGNILAGDYNFHHVKTGISEAGSECVWKISDSNNGTYTNAGTGKSYLVTGADSGKYIKFEVTPKIGEYPSTGATVSSAPVLIEGGLGGGSGGSGGGGGGGGSGGGTVTAVTNIPVNYEEEPVPAYQQASHGFRDISGHWAEQDIEYMVKQGVVKGTGEGTFSPEDYITRAEFAALISRAISLEPIPYTNRYSDVAAGEWYADVVQAAADANIISGYDGKFRPEDTITREEMTKIIIEAYKYKVDEDVPVGAAVVFEDSAEISSWAVEYVSAANVAGFVNGVSDSVFAPKENATRAQAAVIIRRLFDSIQ